VPDLGERLSLMDGDDEGGNLTQSKVGIYLLAVVVLESPLGPRNELDEVCLGSERVRTPFAESQLAELSRWRRRRGSGLGGHPVV
jgi:hypothetical protein